VVQIFEEALMTAPTIPGAEPFSHHGTGSAGVLVLHGFTGNPGSMLGLAQACASAGFHVELPQLAGHGTAMEDMIPARWADWSRDVEAAYQLLAQRATQIVVMGLSMGGSLTLWCATQHPDIAGIVCVNPATQPQAPEVMEMIKGMIDSGTEVMEGIGSDIADPDVVELAYPGTPLAPLYSFQHDGLTPLSQQYGHLKMPLLLFTSVQDHVVSPTDSDALAAQYGGTVERVMLERSYHVATQDFDKQTIFDGAVAFARKVTR
jgi:carboxylesterase